MTQTHRAAEVRWTLQPAQLAAWLAACETAGAFAVPRPGEDKVPSPIAGAVVPPMAAVLGTVPLVATPLLRALQAEGSVEPGAPLLHGDEEVVWTRALRVGEPLWAGGEVAARARSAAGLAVRLVARLRTLDGATVMESSSSLLFARGARGFAARRVQAAVPPSATEVARWRVPVDQPERYAAASGDDNPLHLDDAAAQALGLQRRPLHGMCSLACAAHRLAGYGGIVRAGGGALRRLRARFRAPVYPGDALALYATPGGGDAAWRFVVVNDGGDEVLARGAADFGPRGQPDLG